MEPYTCKEHNYTGVEVCPDCFIDFVRGRDMHEEDEIQAAARNLPQADVKPLLSDVLAELHTKSVSGEHAYNKVDVVDMEDVREILSKYFT